MISLFRRLVTYSISAQSLSTTDSCGLYLLQTNTCGFQQNRGRKRGLKAQLSREQKLERRLKRESKEAARKQYSFMERIYIRRMKSMLSPSQQYPGRLIRGDELKLPDRPTTNIFIRSAFKTQFYPIHEALKMHREMQQPAIYNNENAPVRLRFELNMTTEKATKMVANSDEIVPVPNPFQHNEKRTILAFAQDPAIRELAIENGAETALGADMIKKILKGHFRTDDYDICVGHLDMASALLPLRGILKTRFPTKLNGGLGENLIEIIEKFKRGVKLPIRGDPIFPAWGLCDCVVGMLGMSDQAIEENVEAVVRAICVHRNLVLGPFINRAVLMVIPGNAYFAIDIEKYVPVASDEEIKKFELRKGNKKKKEVKQDVVTDDLEAVMSS